MAYSLLIEQLRPTAGQTMGRQVRRALRYIADSNGLKRDWVERRVIEFYMRLGAAFAAYQEATQEAPRQAFVAEAVDPADLTVAKHATRLRHRKARA